MLYFIEQIGFVKKEKKWTNDEHYVHDFGNRRMTDSYLMIFEKS